MNYKIFYSLIFLFVSLIGFSQAPQSEHLISIKTFKALPDSAYTLVDLRKPEEFEKGHIPNAINLWRTHIVDSTQVIGGLKISRDSLQVLLQKNGIKPTDKIIIYDAKGDVDAARLWWMLNLYGHPNTALLNGGLTEWENQNLPLSTQTQTLSPSQYRFPNPENDNLYISFNDMKKAVNDTNILILDTRSYDEYIGKTLKKGAYRKGRIPRSQFIDWCDGVNYNGDMKFKDLSDLKSIYSFNNAPKNQPIITYCQSGVRSAHTTFILTELLGYTNVRNYDGSWIEWSYHADLDIETGEPITESSTSEQYQDGLPWIYILSSIILLILVIFIVYRKK